MAEREIWHLGNVARFFGSFEVEHDSHLLSIQRIDKLIQRAEK